MNDISDTPVIDRDHLARYTLGDVGLEREVLGLFIGQIPETLAHLDGAQDDEARIRAAHTLKGSARAVGAKRIAEVAERIERAVREGRDAAPLRNALEQACDEVRDLIMAGL